MQSKVHINALGVCSGGGKKLLFDLIQVLRNQSNVTFWLDSRVKGDHIAGEVLVGEGARLNWMNGGFFSRLRLDMYFARKLNKSDVLICLNNIPPFFSADAKTILFLQNRHILEPREAGHVGLKGSLRLFLLTNLLRMNLGNVDRIIVQSPSMKALLVSKNAAVEICSVLPSVKYSTEVVDSCPRPPVLGRLIYVADASPHKNHANLIRAFAKLVDEVSDFQLEIVLTIKKTQLAREIRDIIDEKSLKILFLSEISHNELIEQYKKVDALVYPSFVESFGLPLVEAWQVGLPIIASEKDFVRDVCDPVETFDPASVTSISRAIMRFYGKTPKQQRKFFNAREFFDFCLEL